MQKKKKIRHKLYPILLICMGSAFVFLNYIQYKNYRKLNNQANQILNDIQKENDKQKKLQSQIKSYDSDEYIEKTAREKLGFIKSNEIIFIPDGEEQ